MYYSVVKTNNRAEVTIERNGQYRHYINPTKSSLHRMQRVIRRLNPVIHLDESQIRVAGFKEWNR